MKITKEGRLPNKRQKKLGLLATVLILNKKLKTNKIKGNQKQKRNKIIYYNSKTPQQNLF